MKRFFLFPFLLLICFSSAYAKNNFKKILIPNYDEFTDCKKDGDVRNNFILYKCNQKNPNTSFPLINENKIHITFVHNKAVNEMRGITLHTTSQMYLDCKLREIVYKTVDFKQIKNGKIIDEKITETEDQRTKYKITNKNDHKDAVELIQKYCPVKEGYERIGGTQFDFKNMLKRKEFRNVSTFNGFDYEYTMTFNCKKMLFGVNDEPSIPIKPKSLGDKLFKKVC